MGRNKREGFGLWQYGLFVLATAAVFVLCVCVGSVNVPLSDIWAAVAGFADGRAAAVSQSIILAVRLPRVLCTMLMGAALSLCGGAMQGLLRNPLADGSTLGVSTSAALGATVAIAFGLALPGIAGGGIMLMAMLFAFLALVCILALAYKLDYSLSTNTIILIGIIFSMFAGAMISLVVTFSGDKAKTILFWTMGSLAGSGYRDVLTMLVALIVCAAVVLRHAQELNAFAIGEENARHVGINVRKVKLLVLVAVSALIGVSVSIGGTIGFVGLIIPHITRMVTGPNHRRVLPACLFLGGMFLMLADLASRILLNPLELPVGVVTSIIGSVVFVYIFYTTRRVR